MRISWSTTAALLTLAACQTTRIASRPNPPAHPPAAPAPAATDQDLAVLVKLATAGPGLHEYPQADAIVAVDRDDVSLQPDGTVIEHHLRITRLLVAQRGKRKYADVHIPYDTKRQTLRIQVARTVNADGVPHVARKEEISDIVPPAIARATVYSGMRERVVSFPAVDRGSVIELEYTRTTRPTPDAPMGGELLLGTWDPILDRTVTITAPAGVTPKVQVEGVRLTPAEATKGTARVWTYHLTNQPDRHPETGQVPDALALPRLVYSFEQDWAKVRNTLADRFLAEAVPARLPAAVQAESDRIVQGASGDQEKAQRIFAFVAHEIRSVHLPLGWAGYQPHPPDVVLANRYADQRDKVALLLAMCAAEGISGEPVFVPTGGVPVVAGVPTIAQFDRLLALITVAGQPIWLDPSDEDGRFGLALAGQDNEVLPIVRDGPDLVRRPMADPAVSTSRIGVRLVLNGQGDLDARYHYELTGWYADAAIRTLRPLRGSELDQFFERRATDVAPSALDHGHQIGDTSSVTGPFQIDEHVRAKGWSAAQGHFRAVELPPVPLGFAADLPIAGLTRRRYAMTIAPPRTEVRELTLRVPVGWKVAAVPPKVDATGPGIRISLACSASRRVVKCHQTTSIDRLAVQPADYPVFRRTLNQLRRYADQVVLLVKR